MARLKGRTYQQAAPRPARERQAQVLAQLHQGLTDPVLIAKAIGVSKEAVIYHARSMASVELVHDGRNRRRTSLRLVAPATVTTEDAA